MESVGVPIYWNVNEASPLVIPSNTVRCNREMAMALFETLIMNESTIVITRRNTSAEINIACSIELIALNNLVIGNKYFMETFEKGRREKVFDLNPEINLNNMHAYQTTIRGTIIFFKNINLSHVKEEATAFNKLSDDFSVLFNRGSAFADVQLSCGSMVISAHKNVLSARSPVFAAMFRTDMKESRDGTVVIKHMQPSILKSMLLYIYCGKVQQLNVSTASELLVAADMYQLPELGTICCDYLITALSMDNVLDILVVGNMHDIKLKATAVDFICKIKQFSTLKTTDKWESLQAENPSLAMEVLSSVVEYIQGKEKGLT